MSKDEKVSKTAKAKEWAMKKQSLKDKGYYSNWTYEYVKNTATHKIITEGIRDREVLIQIYWNELGSIARKKKLISKTTVKHIENYGMSCLKYWMDYYKLP